MIEIIKEEYLMKMSNNDLWTIGIIIRDKIIYETKLKWIKYYKGDGSGFLSYVELQMFKELKYLKYIFHFLGREDIVQKLYEDLVGMFVEAND